MPVAGLNNAPWLLLMFSLPARNGSHRVEIWRKLQKYGTIALPSSGHLLPNSPTNQERMEWLATAIRNYKGQASVVQVQHFDDLPADRLKQSFVQARSRDYERLLRELTTLTAMPRSTRPSGKLTRLRQKFQGITAIDFFGSAVRSKVERAFEQAEENRNIESRGRKLIISAEYSNRLWITRPRPGIDRVSSAWLIRRFIDPKGRFIFGNDPDNDPQAIPYDMFSAKGFGHKGDDCTFENLRKHFGIKDSRVKSIGEIVHDADLNDNKFGRCEGEGLDRVLTGWAKQDVPDDELLRRGIEMIAGLYEVVR